MFNVRHMDKNELYITAQMARLKLSETETHELEKAVSQMLEYFEKMKEVDVKELEPTTHALLKDNRLRKDGLTDNKSDPEDILKNAPELEDRFIVIPNVL